MQFLRDEQRDLVVVVVVVMQDQGDHHILRLEMVVGMIEYRDSGYRGRLSSGV